MDLELKDKIKSLRESLNLTLEDVAKIVGVSAPTVQRWESGEIKNLRRDKIALLAKALQTTPSYLMGWLDEDESVNRINKEEKELKKTLDTMREQLLNTPGLMFDGEPLHEETIAEVLKEIERQEILIKAINKKYTPKKYRKK